MKNRKVFTIKKSSTENLWLDSWNGGTDFEWTDSPYKGAWRLDAEEAKKRLASVLRYHPEAIIDSL